MIISLIIYDPLRELIHEKKVTDTYDLSSILKAFNYIKKARGSAEICIFCFDHRLISDDELLIRCKDYIGNKGEEIK